MSQQGPTKNKIILFSIWIHPHSESTTGTRAYLSVALYTALQVSQESFPHCQGQGESFWQCWWRRAGYNYERGQGESSTLGGGVSTTGSEGCYWGGKELRDTVRERRGKRSVRRSLPPGATEEGRALCLWDARKTTWEKNLEAARKRTEGLPQGGKQPGWSPPSRGGLFDSASLHLGRPYRPSPLRVTHHQVCWLQQDAQLHSSPHELPAPQIQIWVPEPRSPEPLPEWRTDGPIEARLATNIQGGGRGEGMGWDQTALPRRRLRVGGLWWLNGQRARLGGKSGFVRWSRWFGAEAVSSRVTAGLCYGHATCLRFL